MSNHAANTRRKTGDATYRHKQFNHLAGWTDQVIIRKGMEGGVHRQHIVLSFAGIGHL
jgi:hypothetical protein